jgi:hypothetical protein
MSLKPPTCPKCKKFEFRMGPYGDDGLCRCAEKRRTATPREPKRNPAFETSSLSIVEQLERLLNLRLEGALTEEEFTTLKTRLISGGGH